MTKRKEMQREMAKVVQTEERRKTRLVKRVRVTSRRKR